MKKKLILTALLLSLSLTGCGVSKSAEQTTDSKALETSSEFSTEKTDEEVDLESETASGTDTVFNANMPNFTAKDEIINAEMKQYVIQIGDTIIHREEKLSDVLDKLKNESNINLNWVDTNTSKIMAYNEYKKDTYRYCVYIYYGEAEEGGTNSVMDLNFENNTKATCSLGDFTLDDIFFSQQVFSDERADFSNAVFFPGGICMNGSDIPDYSDYISDLQNSGINKIDQDDPQCINANPDWNYVSNYYYETDGGIENQFIVDRFYGDDTNHTNALIIFDADTGKCIKYIIYPYAMWS